MESFVFGKSAGAIPIPGYVFGHGHPRVLILGGVHGNEPEGIALAHGLWGEFVRFFPYRLEVTLIPCFNMDGALAGRRTNANGVDLNRNLPTKDWNPKSFSSKYPPGTEANSEPENKALTSWISQQKPQFIFSLHSWVPMLNVNGACEPVASVLQKWTGYPIEASVGYPTPGCLGTYAGLERNIPTITYEIERGLTSGQVLSLHLPAVIEALKTLEVELL